MEDVRKVVQQWSFIHCVPMKLKSNNKTEFRVVCPEACDMKKKEKKENKACLFSISAYYRYWSQNITFAKNCVWEHKEHCAARKLQTTTAAVKEYVAPLIHTTPTTKSKDDVPIIREKCGISLPYHTSWKAMSQVKADDLWLDELSIQKLSNYLSQMKDTNSGTIVDFQRHGMEFHRAFLAPGVGTKAFKFLLPAIIIDACHMKTKQGGMIFGASGMTSEMNIYPLAIAVAPTENENNWRWFLELLLRAIPEINQRSVFIASDRDKGLKAAQHIVLPNASHSICLQHLQRNVKDKFHTKYEGRIWAAAKASTIEEYNQHMAYIRGRINGEEAFHYLQACRTEWANVFFPVPRYGILTSNSAESLNSSIEELRYGSYLYVFASFSFNLAPSIFSYHEEFMKLASPLTRSSLNKWFIALDHGKRREVTQIGPMMFGVSPQVTAKKPDKTIRIVDLSEKKCSCGSFQEEQFPCLHAAGAIYVMNLNFLDFIDSKYTVETLRRVYDCFLTPIDIAQVFVDGRTQLVPVRGKRGRPRKRRFRSRGEGGEGIRKTKCGNCGQSGHYATTCQQNTTSNSGGRNISGLEEEALGKKARKKCTCKVCGKTGHNKATCKDREQSR